MAGVVLMAVVAVSLLASPAAATRCVPPAAPKVTITGSDEFSMGGKFFEHFDGVVLGEVVSVTVDPGMAPGGVKIRVDTYGAIGASSVPATVTVSADDDGKLNGYAFNEGASYFIPLQNKGPQGQTNYSFLCDPIAEINGPNTAEGLLALARREGHEAAVTGQATATEPAEAGGPISHGIPGRSFSPRMVAIAAAAALGLGAALLLRRRRAST